MNDIGCARGFDSAVKFAALAALSVQAESSLHQFEVQWCPLVKTKHVTVSATHDVRAGRPKAELCKLRVC